MIDTSAQRPIRCRGDAGEVTSTALVFPAYLVLILVVVQAGLAWHAKTMVDAAASDALAATQVEGGTADDGSQAAADLLGESTEQLLTEVSTTVDRDGQTTTVRIEGRVTNVVPLIPFRVRATASGPTERFRSDVESPP